MEVVTLTSSDEEDPLSLDSVSPSKRVIKEGSVADKRKAEDELSVVSVKKIKSQYNNGSPVREELLEKKKCENTPSDKRNLHNTTPFGKRSDNVSSKKDDLKSDNSSIDDVIVLKERIKDGRGIFNKFVEECRSLRNEEDMEQIIQKAWKKFEAASKSYTSSEDFKYLVKERLKILTRGKVYVHLKDIVDELMVRKCRPKKKEQENGVVSKVEFPKLHDPDRACSSKDSDAENKQIPNVVGEKSDDDRRINVDDVPEEHRKTVKKLRKLLMRLNTRIQMLEEKECDWDDEADSSYMQLERYKTRFCQVYSKICKYTAEREKPKRVKIAYSGSPYQELNIRLEDFVNKRNQFPDYHDILKIVKETCVDKSPDQQHKLATHAFTTIGEQLQRQRMWDDWSSLSAHLVHGKPDPVENNPELLTVLKKNQDIAKKNMTNILENFVRQQEEKKLEAVEVAEDEAEISAGEGSGQEEEEEAKQAEEESDNDDNIKDEAVGSTTSDTDKSDSQDEHCRTDKSPLDIIKSNGNKKSSPNKSDVETIETSDSDKPDNENKQCISNNDDNSKSSASDSDIETSIKNDVKVSSTLSDGQTSPPRWEEYSPSLLENCNDNEEQKYGNEAKKRQTLTLKNKQSKPSPPDTKLSKSTDGDDDIILLD